MTAHAQEQGRNPTFPYSSPQGCLRVRHVAKAFQNFPATQEGAEVGGNDKARVPAGNSSMAGSAKKCSHGSLQRCSQQACRALSFR
jgi:hypothetical protein